MQFVVQDKAVVMASQMDKVVVLRFVQTLTRKARPAEKENDNQICSPKRKWRRSVVENTRRAGDQVCRIVMSWSDIGWLEKVLEVEKCYG